MKSRKRQQKNKWRRDETDEELTADRIAEILNNVDVWKMTSPIIEMVKL